MAHPLARSCTLPFAFALIWAAEAAAERPDIRWIRPGPVGQSGAISPDGSLALTLYAETARVWRGADGGFIRSLPVCGASHAAFSPDGRSAAIGACTGVQLLATSSWEVERVFAAAHIGRVQFTAGGDHLIGANTYAVYLWRVADGERLQTFNASSDIDTAAVSPDGEFVAAAGSGSLWLWSTSDGSLRYTLPVAYRYSISIAFSPDSALLAITGQDAGGVSIRDVSSGAVVQRLDEDECGGVAVTFSPDGTTLASASGCDALVKLWSTSDWTRVRDLTWWFFWATDLAFTADAAKLLVVNGDGSIWSTLNGSELARMQGHPANWWHTLAFLRDGHTLLAAEWWLISLLDVRDGSPVRDFHFNQGNTLDADLTPDESSIVVAGGGALERLNSQGEQIWIVFTNADQVDISPQGELFATSGRTLRRVSDGSVVRNLGTPYSSRGVEFSPDGRLVASGRNHSPLVDVLDVETGETLATLDTSPSYANLAVFSPDGRYLATAGRDWLIRLWDMTDYTLVRAMPGHTDLVHALRFSTDSRLLASAGRDNQLLLWSIPGGSRRRAYDDETFDPRSIGFSADNRLIAYGRGDGTLVMARNLLIAGDLNCDGSVNQSDIDPFITALADPAAYAVEHPDCELTNADCNNDGSVNQFDLQPFIERLR